LVPEAVKLRVTVSRGGARHRWVALKLTVDVLVRVGLEVRVDVAVRVKVSVGLLLSVGEAVRVEVKVGGGPGYWCPKP